MKKQLTGVFCAGLLSLGMVSMANAALLTRLGGLAVYDTDLNITWLTDANAGAGSSFDNGFSVNDGRMTWVNANAWAASLSVGGFTDWRLPTTLQPDSSCSFQGSSGGVSFSSRFDCTGSEMGHLFYNELGGTAFNSILSSSDSDLDLFSNVQSNNYWSATEFAPNTFGAWNFDFLNGNQVANVKNDNLFAWAVRSGDVSAVPVPAAVWLFGSGLIGLLGFKRRVR